MRCLFLLVMLSAALPAVLLGQRPAATPIPPPRGRSETLATHGMVASSHPLASQIGLEVLRKGGNATDAAIAVNAALGLMEPMSCGVGGDLYALVWDSKTQKLYGLNASGRSPYRATLKHFADAGLKEIPETGPLSWSVPGCVDGWETLRTRFGSQPLAQLLEPSIVYAEEGFPVTEVIAGYWRASERTLQRHPDAARTFLPAGHAPRTGEVFKNPALARTYREIARGGRDAYYKGRIAEEIVAFSDKNGGLFAARDFTDNASTWVEPVSTRYRGYDVWAIPPPGQGISVLQMLNLLEGYDLEKMGFAADYWHLFLEAKKLAYADRARYFADPEFAQVPVAELIAKGYADKRRGLIDPLKAAKEVEAGDPRLGRSDTVYFCVVDKDRNCVSMIQSNYMGFGSGLVPGNLGFALQNRGTLFALDDKHPNRLEPHKRPFHTIIPGFVSRAGKPYLVFGVMGGDMQPQGQVEVLVNHLDFGMNIQQAGDAPRLEHRGSATPTGKPAQGVGRVYAEPGISDAVIRELETRGHQVVRTPRNGGGYQAVRIDPETGVLHGASEARKDGCAVGY